MILHADPLAATIVAFLERIGIAVNACELGDATFLPGVALRNGALLVDSAKLAWPSDLLHEAGHVAVTDSADRPHLCEVRDDPGEEMAAIAWSYAAAVEIGLDPRLLFHDSYKGGGEALAAAFEGGGGVGVPLLRWFGMTGDDYPRMARWLR